MLQALAGAKQVHMFDRRADETIGWIQEKDAVLSAQGYGQDLETIQALIRQHQVFETDLAAVKEQVRRVVCLVGVGVVGRVCIEYILTYFLFIFFFRWSQ
jgi:hypothetical protein